jgi:hypothetical protein
MVLFCGLAPVPANAGQATAFCTFNYDNGLATPGLTMAALVAGHFSSGPSPLDSHGLVAGREPTGVGTIEEHGTFEGSCAHGTGSSVLTISIPTTKGALHLELPILFDWLGATGTIDSPQLKGTWAMYSTSGDCVTEPVTTYRQVSQGLWMRS